MDLKTHLRQLYELHATDLADFAWKYETDRWAEMVFCLLLSSGPQQPEKTRVAVTLLDHLGLLDVERLAHIDEQPGEEKTVIRYILERHGFPPEDSARAIAVLTEAAKTIRLNYGGKLQRYLRRHGEVMRDELASTFAALPLDDAQLRHAFSHWLQNTLSLPISLEHPAIDEFCGTHNATREDLVNAADEMDLNLALLDDLLELSTAIKKAPAEEQVKVKGAA